MRIRIRAAVAAVLSSLLAVAPVAALARGAHPAHRSDAPTFWVEGWTAAGFFHAADGGVLAIPGIVRVEIPANALPRDMVISVRAEIVHAGSDTFVAFTFGPSGTVFDVPLVVTASPRLLRGTSASTVYYNSGVDADGHLVWDPTGATESVGPADDPDGLVGRRYTFLVHHFSRYALGSVVSTVRW